MRTEARLFWLISDNNRNRRFLRLDVAIINYASNVQGLIPSGTQALSVWSLHVNPVPAFFSRYSSFPHSSKLWIGGSFEATSRGLQWLGALLVYNFNCIWCMCSYLMCTYIYTHIHAVDVHTHTQNIIKNFNRN